VEKILRANVPYKYHFGLGLYLIIEGGSATWKHRYQMDGKAHWASLRVADVADLVEAKRRHLAMRQQIADNNNPVEERRAAKQKAREAKLNRKTFKECAEEFMEQRKATEWKDRDFGTYDDWKSSLEYYVYPIIGDIDVNALDRPHIKAVMTQPPRNTSRHPATDGKLWATRGHTAHFVRNRIELIIVHAIANRYRTATEGLDENPARKKTVEAMMGSKAARKRANLIPLPYAKLRGFMEKLRDDQEGRDIAARAGEFLILTQVREEEVCGAKRAEFHLDPEEHPQAPVWIIPGSRMKGRRIKEIPDHMVPLSPQAIELLKSLPEEKGNPYVFIGSKRGVQRVDKSSVGKLPKRFGYDGVKLPKFHMHAMRVTFGEWGFLERINLPADILDFCWAHVVGNMTTQVYLRTTKFDQRRKVMNQWGAEITDGLKPLRTPEMRAAEQKERQRISNQEYRAGHPEENKAANAKWRREHHEEISAQKKAAYAANPEPMKEYQREYRAANPEITRVYQQGYRAGLRAALDITPQPRGAQAIPRTPETERVYQKGYRAGKARAKKGGVTGYRPEKGLREGEVTIGNH
jgi:integrase